MTVLNLPVDDRSRFLRNIDRLCSPNEDVAKAALRRVREALAANPEWIADIPPEQRRFVHDRKETCEVMI